MKKYILYVLKNGKKETIREIVSTKNKEEIRKEYAYLNPTGIDSINC